MTAVYTFDVLATLDGFGSYGPDGDWGGYWGKQGPEFLARRGEQYSGDFRMVLGAVTFRQFVEMMGPQHRSAEGARPRERPDAQHADHCRLEHARRAPRLAGRHP